MSDYTLADAFALLFDELDPRRKEVERLNERQKRIPFFIERYWFVNGHIEDIYLRDKPENIRFIYDRGYVYIGNIHGEKYFPAEGVPCSRHRYALEDLLNE